jgi:hypothetical protein
MSSRVMVPSKSVKKMIYSEWSKYLGEASRIFQTDSSLVSASAPDRMMPVAATNRIRC